MSSNVVSEAGLPTRLNQWWGAIPFITSGVVIICGIIYLICLFVGYDSFVEICFLPSELISKFQVYRIYTSILFHGSLLHVVFNMLALVPLGSELERIMGSIRFLHAIFLLATSSAIFHLLVALMVAHNPVRRYPYFMNECAIGFSGVIFSLIVMETSLSGVQSRSVFGLFSVPAKWYALILLVVIQLLMTNVSLLGHLCGILSGFAYTNGFFNFLLPGPSFYSAIESSSLFSTCVRRPGYVLCTGGTPYGQLPTYTSMSPTSSGLVPGNLWRNISSWIPQREAATDQPAEDSRFPGRGRTLGSSRNQSASRVNSDSSLQASLLDTSHSDHPSEAVPLRSGQRLSDGRHSTADGAAAAGVALTTNQGSDNFDEVIEKLVTMGFEKTQAEVALAAADGNPNVAVEILMSQQG